MEKIPSIFIRKILCLNILSIFLLFQPETSSAQSNSILGLVYDSRHTPIKDVEVYEIRHKDKIIDTTNSDGLYCVKIPKSCPNYQLQYQKEGFIDFVDAEPIPNNTDPQKRAIIMLLGPNDIASSSKPELQKVIGNQIAIFNFARQSKLYGVLCASKTNFELISNNIGGNPNIDYATKWTMKSELNKYIDEAKCELPKYKHY